MESEWGMATFEDRKPSCGYQNWREEGTIRYKKIIRVNHQDTGLIHVDYVTWIVIRKLLLDHFEEMS